MKNLVFVFMLMLLAFSGIAQRPFIGLQTGRSWKAEPTNQFAVTEAGLSFAPMKGLQVDVVPLRLMATTGSQPSYQYGVSCRYWLDEVKLTRAQIDDIISHVPIQPPIPIEYDAPSARAWSTLTVPTNECDTVLKFVDGDTWHFKLGGVVQSCRLYGAGAPEFAYPGICGKEQPFARAVSDSVSQFIKGKCLKIETHGNDYYGRPLVQIWVDGVDLAWYGCLHGWYLPEKRGISKPYYLQLDSARDYAFETGLCIHSDKKRPAISGSAWRKKNPYVAKPKAVG